jgi:hypothetical protein
MTLGLSPMVKRCFTCRCVLRFRISSRQENLCPHELKRDFTREARERGDWSYYQHRMNGYGTYPVWGISYTCPGCGSVGTRYEPRYSEDEANIVVAAQNVAEEEAERQGEPSRWQEVVWERKRRAARNLADRFVSRFPQWKDYIRPFPADPAAAEAQGDGSGYILVLEIPSEHPCLSDALKVFVQTTETLVVWGDWHDHVNARDNDTEDREPPGDARRDRKDRGGASHHCFAAPWEYHGWRGVGKCP